MSSVRQRKNQSNTRYSGKDDPTKLLRNEKERNGGIITAAVIRKAMFYGVLIAVIAIASGAAWFFLGPMPTAGVFPVPPITQWRPHQGLRTVWHEPRDDDFKVQPIPNAFHTMHVGLENSDNLWTVAAPMVEFDWVAEKEFFIPEGPTIDYEGNIYFSPLNPKEDVSLVSLDSNGRRRWTIPGGGPGAGAILILNDPNHEGKQIIYHCTSSDVWALRQDGSVVWHVKANLEIKKGKDKVHMWGMNWHRPSDNVIGLSIDGQVGAFDRKTGKMSTPWFALPCDPAKGNSTVMPPKWAVNLGDRETDKAFGKLNDGTSVFSTIINVIFGGGFCVSNYFAVDPNTGKLYIAATAADADDGEIDGLSEDGALYQLELLPAHGEYPLHFRVINSAKFPGGTGSTPTISADSKRLLVSDDNHNVLCLDATDLSTLWAVNVGDQVAASIAVAPEGDIYAVTKGGIFRIEETSRTSAKIKWVADITTAFPGTKVINALTPTITANGVVVSCASVVTVTVPWAKKQAQLLTKVGMGLLDRETGKLRYFAEGMEESIAVTVVDHHGAYYQAGSPVRRAISVGLWGSRLRPLGGGISRYKPIRHDILLRDAICAASHRCERAVKYWTSDSYDSAALHASSVGEVRQLSALVDQALWAVGEQISHGSRNGAIKWEEVSAKLSNLARIFKIISPVKEINHMKKIEAAAVPLAHLCKMWDIYI